MSIFTLNNLVDLFRNIANAHYNVQYFGFGELWEVDGITAKQMGNYPVLWVIPTGAIQEENTTVFNFDVYAFDLVKEDESNETKVLSDCIQILQDVVRIIRDESDDYELADFNNNFQPFTEKFNERCTGWFVSIGVRVAFDATQCEIPADAFTAEGTSCQPVLIYDGEGNLIDTIPSGGSYICDAGGGPCDDATVENSDETYSATVASGGMLVLPDITFTDTTGVATSVPSVKNITATQINALSCAQLNDADNGLTFAQRQVIQAVRGLKTGQTTSYRTGDDGDYQFGRGASFTTLNCNNPFGNTNRFTDQSGGSTYSDNIVVDWLTGLMWYRIPTGGTWNQAVDGSEAATTGGYTDWFLPNKMQIYGLVNDEQTDNNAINYSPFNISITGIPTIIWTSTTIKSNTANARGLNQANTCGVHAKTNTSQYIYCRHFTLADLGF
jgi:hypothetical protein